MDDKPNGWRNQKELAEERRVEISKLCDVLDSKDKEITRLFDICNEQLQMLDADYNASALLSAKSEIARLNEDVKKVTDDYYRLLVLKAKKDRDYSLCKVEIERLKESMDAPSEENARLLTEIAKLQEQLRECSGCFRWQEERKAELSAEVKDHQATMQEMERQDSEIERLKKRVNYLIDNWMLDTEREN